MEKITTAAQLRIAQLQGLRSRQTDVEATPTPDEAKWAAAELEMNLRNATALAYHRNEHIMQMQFSEDGLRTYLKYARQPRGSLVRPEHALNAATRCLLGQLYDAGFTLQQEYQNDEIPGTLWSPRGPQRLMLRWA
jgi:hypothetical protein